MTPRACLRTADKLYLDFILVKIYLEIDVRIRTRTLGAGCVDPAVSCGWGFPT